MYGTVGGEGVVYHGGWLIVGNRGPSLPFAIRYICARGGTQDVIRMTSSRSRDAPFFGQGNADLHKGTWEEDRRYRVYLCTLTIMVQGFLNSARWTPKSARDA